MSRTGLRESVLLLTDVVDSTKLSGVLGDVRMARIWAAHDRAARDLLVPHHGREIDKTDGFLLLFENVSDAAAYALAYHRAIATFDPPLQARAGLHTGDVILTENAAGDVARGAKPLEVDGFAKHIAARIMGLAIGGQTLVSETARTALAKLPEAWEVRSHGHFRLKGVAEPMELFEVGVRGESPFAPPADAAKAYRVVRSSGLWRPAREIPHSLPAERDAFVGRRGELQELARRLDEGERLVTVTGMGGTGKTRFVRRYGWTWLGDWPGGVFFCDLSEARTVDGIVSAVATALDVPLGIGDAVVQLGHAIAGRRRCLILLDNFEQVAEHAGATLCRWVERAAEASFVVTSREILAVPGEHVLPLEPLAAEGPGVELFVVRTKARKEGFALTAANEKTVHEIVTLLDGLPLAIELAAARAAILSPEQLLIRLKDRFQILVGARGVRARQATLRAAIDWSWTLLSPWEQAALAQASVFVGGFTLEAAENVLDLSPWPEAPPVMDVMQSLVDKSLIRTWIPGAGQRLAIDEPYFGMYVSIHEYAVEKLRTGGTLPAGAGIPEVEHRAFERHGRYFAQFGTEDALDALKTHGCVARRQSLSLDLENLIAACRRAVFRRDGPTAVETCAAAWVVLISKGPLLAAELGRQVLQLGALRPLERSRALLHEASALQRAGRIEEAQTHLEASLAIAREEGNRRHEAKVLIELAILHMETGRMDEALRHCEAALTITREVGDRVFEGVVLSNLGAVYGYWDQEKRLHHYEAALEIHREVGDRKSEGIVLTNLGELCAHQGRIEEALRDYQAALAIQREIGNRRFEGHVFSDLGILYFEQGRIEEALQHYEAALEIHREVGDRRSEGIVLTSLGELGAHQGRIEEALRDYQAARAIQREIGDRRSEGVTLGNLGRLHARQGLVEEAKRDLHTALAIHRDVGDRRYEGVTLGELGRLLTAQGRFEEARRLLTAAEALLRSVDNSAHLGVLLCQRGECEHLAGDNPAAGPYLEEAERLAHELAVGPDSELAREIGKLRMAIEGAAS